MQQLQHAVRRLTMLRLMPLHLAEVMQNLLGRRRVIERHAQMVMRLEPLAISFGPQKIRLNGIALLRRPMIRKSRQSPGSRGIRRPPARTSMCSIDAARPTRPSTMLIGGTSLTATLAKKNDPPQRIESTISSSQSPPDMARMFGLEVETVMGARLRAR
jgi:hypothetical protein